ncbi:MAG: hypothetical protein HY774_09125 [Acidobacteria bacterium]|nr:hypothetical protein [Acidobacteriota bacterium]
MSLWHSDPPQFFLGLDLGQSKDYTALTIIERIETNGGDVVVQQVRHLQRWKLRTSYPTIVREVTAMLNQPPLRHADTTLAIDGTGVGRPVVDLFWNVKTDALIRPVQIVAGSKESHNDGFYHVPKRELVSLVQVALQTRQLRIAAELPEAEVLVKELINFQVKITDAANDTYGAWREGQHDDLVLATALALWASEKGGGRAEHGPSLDALVNNRWG